MQCALMQGYLLGLLLFVGDYPRRKEAKVPTDQMQGVRNALGYRLWLAIERGRM